MGKTAKTYAVRTEVRAGEPVAALYELDDEQMAGAALLVPHDEWEALGSPRRVRATITLAAADDEEE